MYQITTLSPALMWLPLTSQSWVAVEAHHRCAPAEDLLDRLGHEAHVFEHLLALLGVLDEGQHPVGQGVAGGLVAGDGEQQEEHVELELGEGVALDLGPEQDRHHVVLGVLLAPGRQVVGVGVELHGGVEGVVVAAGVLGVVGADEAVRPVEDLEPVLLGDAEDVGDDLEGELGGDVGDEVALALLADGVDDARRPVAHGVVELLDHAGREALVDEQPVPRVQRRVHVEHHLLLHGEGLVVHVGDHGPALGRGEALPVAVDLDHVGVAGEAPEAGPVGLVLPERLVRLPELVEPVERHLLDVVAALEQIDGCHGVPPRAVRVGAARTSSTSPSRAPATPG
jgi:hypothetical protein